MKDDHAAPVERPQLIKVPRGDEAVHVEFRLAGLEELRRPDQHVHPFVRHDPADEAEAERFLDHPCAEGSERLVLPQEVGGAA